MRLIEWFTPTENLIELGFSTEEIETAITESGISLNDLTEEKGFIDIPTWMRKYEVISDKYRYKTKKYQGEWEKKVEVSGYKVRVPHTYQGLSHAKVLYCLFSNRWEWFNKFTTTKEIDKKIWLSGLPASKLPDEYKDTPIKKLSYSYIIAKEVETNSSWSLYEYRKDYEMYLRTELGTLYVPLKALLDSDIKIVKERMVSYYKGYYDYKDAAYKKAIAPLQSKEFKQLKGYLLKTSRL